MTTIFLQIWIFFKNFFKHVKGTWIELIFSLIALVLSAFYYKYCNVIPVKEHYISFNQLACNNKSNTEIELSMRLNYAGANTNELKSNNSNWVHHEIRICNVDKSINYDSIDSSKSDKKYSALRDSLSFIENPAITVGPIFEFDYLTKTDGGIADSGSRIIRRNKCSVKTLPIKLITKKQRKYRARKIYVGINDTIDTLYKAIPIAFANELERLKFFNAEDISQIYYKFGLQSNVKIKKLSFDFIGQTNFSNTCPVPDYVSMNTIAFTDPSKINMIKKDGLVFHAAFSDTGNLHETKMFIVCSLLTLLFTLACSSLVKLVAKYRKKKEKDGATDGGK